MKFTFRNVGTVKETELDLRPFTAIIGPNNSNKTYLAYLVYAVWKRVGVQFSTGSARFGKTEVRENGSVLLKVNKRLLKAIAAELQKLASPTSEELDVAFQDTSHELFKETAVEFRISPEDFESAITNFVKTAHLPIRGVQGFELSKEREGLVMNFTSSGMPRDSLANFLLGVGISHHLFGPAYVLPAERNSFVINYKMLANRRYKFMRDAQRELFAGNKGKRQFDLLREQGEVRYPQPVEDFLDLLTEIELEPPERSDNSDNAAYEALASKIEKDIQNNHSTTFVATQLGGRELRLNVKKGVSIDLYNASSSIKQLTPLVLYLRYRAQQGDLLIIDEPEMNLHPESQAKLMEILAILVNLGVRVLITTHSPYIMAHLNNVRLAQPATADKRQEKAASLYLNDPRAFLNPDQVMAYAMDRGKLKDLHDPDYGIRWDTLSDVSADLQQKLFEVHTPDEQEG